MPLLISLEQLCNIRNKRIIRIRIGQERTDGQQHLGNCQSRAPLILENVQTDSSIGIDVAVIDTGGEVHFGWLEGIVCRKVNVKKENSARVWGIVRSHDCSLPVEHVISHGTGGAVCGRIFTKINKFYKEMKQGKIDENMVILQGRKKNGTVICRVSEVGNEGL